MIHFGGPVETDVAIALIHGGEGESLPLVGVSLGDVSTAHPVAEGARIYAGYTGWGPGQLEAEVSEGSWYVIEALASDPFDSPDGQWEKVLRRQGGTLAIVANFPLDATLN
jgi:putative transcriptional regulator